MTRINQITRLQPSKRQNGLPVGAKKTLVEQLMLAVNLPLDPLSFNVAYVR